GDLASALLNYHKSVEDAGRAVGAGEDEQLRSGGGRGKDGDPFPAATESRPTVGVRGTGGRYLTWGCSSDKKKIEFIRQISGMTGRFWFIVTVQFVAVQISRENRSMKRFLFVAMIAFLTYTYGTKAGPLQSQ